MTPCDISSHFVVLKVGILGQKRYFPDANQVFFVLKPNQTIRKALSQDKIEIWTQRNVKEQQK